MNDHFRPVGNPAPPRPRRPDAFISSMIASRPLSRIALVPSQSPRARAPCQPPIVQAVEIGEDAVLVAAASPQLSAPKCNVVSVVGPPSGAEVCRPVIEPGFGGVSARNASSNCFGAFGVQVLVEIVVDLQDRRIDAGAEAFDLGHGEHAVGAGLAPALDAGRRAARRHHVIGAAQPARRRGADLQDATLPTGRRLNIR